MVVAQGHVLASSVFCEQDTVPGGDSDILPSIVHVFTNPVVLVSETAKRDDSEEAENGARHNHDAVEHARTSILHHCHAVVSGRLSLGVKVHSHKNTTHFICTLNTCSMEKSFSSSKH